MNTKIRKLSGGKDPIRLINNFIQRRGQSGQDHLQVKTADYATWLIPLTDNEELEITIEGLRASVETTIYMGVNIMPVPLKKTQEFLTAVLSVADTLIGAKLSLVDYDVVLSVTEYLERGEIDYIFEVITRQKDIIHDAIIDELESSLTT